MIFITRRLLRRVLLSSISANRQKVVLLFAIKNQSRALHYLKAHPLVKSKLKSRPSVRRAPLLRCRLFRLLQRRLFNRNQLLHQPTLQCMLISSQSDKILKVELLIAIKDQAQAPHYLKAHLLNKSQPKKLVVSSLIPLAASAIETCPFLLAPVASI